MQAERENVYEVMSTEHEIKCLLTEEEYGRLLALLEPLPYLREHQTNYYYDTHTGKHRRDNITVRIREKSGRLKGTVFFGVDAAWDSQDLLQNNIDLFEWVVRNKIYPNFFGRNIMGENSLTKEEIRYLHRNVCMIAPTCSCVGAKKTEEQGKLMAMQAAVQALELDIPEGVAIFLELGEEEEASRDFLRGYAKGLLAEGYTPGFKANTDAAFAFDREFSRGMQTDREIFEKCLIWAVAPTVPEYNGMTTTHLIHPDDWKPYAPSGISRKEIAIWQYGKNCHPIEDDSGKVVTFHLDLVRNVDIILDKMF